jgi:hypothetical protein
VLVGSYTDVNNRYNGPGYVSLMTNRTLAEFEDLDIQAETSYSDGFNKNIQFGAYWGRFISSDPNNAGHFAYATQYGGLWFSTDHGASWSKISSDARNGYLHYRPLFSTLRDGNLYTSSGLSFSWRIDSFTNAGTTRQQIGQNLSYSSWLINEDPVDPNRLYTALYDLGISTYEDDDIAGSLAEPIPVRIDFDGDGDIDLDDFAVMQRCLSGPGEAQTDPTCAAALIDLDDDVDSADRDRLLECLSGAYVPADPCCDCPPEE